MDLSVFETMDAPELREYIRFLLWHYRVVDAFWFLNVEERLDQDAAEKLNEKVWARVSGMAARDILKSFRIEERGLKGFLHMLKLYPWTPLVEYDIEEREDEIVLSAPHCPPQEGRLKHGLGEYVCKEMHRQEFLGLAREVDPRIRIECIFAPPDPHPKDVFCKWRFYLEDSTENTASRI
ncbi:MAG: DUF6125 family protein [Syntrophobacteraceae bacterium]|jgi:hypothetical protein